MDEGISEVRQLYLEGFEGGNLKVNEAALVEAYVNGVDGQKLDDMTLCRLYGSRVKTTDAARTTLWKIFADPKPAKKYLGMREYARALRAENKVRSELSAEAWKEYVQRLVMMAAGDMPSRKVIPFKGFVSQRVVRETNLAAMSAGLKMWGQHVGTLDADGSGSDHESFLEGLAAKESGSDESNGVTDGV